MTAYNVVHMRVKPGHEQAFMEMNRQPGHEVTRRGLRRAAMIKTGERAYCFIGEWDDFDAIVKARPEMVEDLSRMRHMLEDLGGGLGVTQAVSGEAVAELSTEFNFSAFRLALEEQDVAAWLAFYADDAEWLEYRHNAPPRAPNRMVGKDQIGAFLHRVKGSDVRLSISDEVIGHGRIAFCLKVAMTSGKAIVENIILHIQNDKIARQVDVEAWDA